MVYAYIQDVPIGQEMHEKIIELLGPEPIQGHLLHLAVRLPGGNLRYIDLWESQEACAKAFDDRIHKAVDAAFGGQRPSVEPTVERLDVVHASGALLPTWTAS